MANNLSMTKQSQIITLHQAGWSQRKIAKSLKINRRTVRKYIEQASKCTIPTARSESEPNSKCTISTTESGSKKIASSGRQSHCEPYRNLIVEGVEKGQSADLIWRDLKTDHDFKHSYESVKRFVRKLKTDQGLIKPVVRMECNPGEEAQVDFGFARTLRTEKGTTKQSNILRVTLSFSRKAYTETLPSQSTECLVRALENAFRHFGGVPATLIVDNLKAAVKKPDWFDPEINPKFADFANHYGVAVLPTKPYTPQHKGKVESDVKYVKNSALKGKVFSSITEQNEHLKNWEKNVADKRIHGTTRKQVDSHFQEYEKAELKELPIALFPSYQEGKRKVHRDAYIEVQKAYYHVPPEYIGREVWARWDSKTLQVFNLKMEPVINHVRLEDGKFSNCSGALGKPFGKAGSAQAAKYWIDQVTTRVGSRATDWAAALTKNNPERSIRIIMGLLQIARSNNYTSADIESACSSALKSGDYTLTYIKTWLRSKANGKTIYEQEQLGLLDEHKIIREMSYYQKFLNETENTDINQ